MVDCSSLENYHVRKGIGGSNPSLSASVVRCPSGLRSTPGKRVYGYAVPWVRIPPSPPRFKYRKHSGCGVI